MPDSVTTINNNIHWMGIRAGLPLDQIWFKWGEKTIQPGYIFDQIGSKKRTSFSLKKPLKYVGSHMENKLRYLLFEVVSEEEVIEEENSEKYNWYIAFLFVIDGILLMPTSNNGFYDIRP
jgi:hypothetical protein